MKIKCTNVDHDPVNGVALTQDDLNFVLWLSLICKVLNTKFL